MSKITKATLDKRYQSLIIKDFSTHRVEEVKEEVQKAFTPISPLPYINNIINSEMYFLRARIIDEQKEDISKIETFGSPPPNFTNIGRANLEKEPVFYATLESLLSMQEIKANKGDICYISAWKKPLYPPMHVTLMNMHVEKNSWLYKWVESSKQEVINTFGLRGEKLDMFFHAMQLRSRLFTEPNYHLTSKLSHDIIYSKSAKSDSLLYPSVINEKKCNFAISNDFAKKHLELRRVYKYVFNNGRIHRLLARGKVENNKVIWEDTGKFNLDDEDIRIRGN